MSGECSVTEMTVKVPGGDSRHQKKKALPSPAGLFRAADQSGPVQVSF